jgi:hypothetical protein
MADYTLAVTWSGKDALADSDANKVISGDDFHTEFTTVQTAINSKADIASETLTGTPIAPTAAVGTDSTQIATTAFVKNVLETYIYPVGSIYFNMAVSTNPGTLLGFGTWLAYAEGRVLVGFQSSGTFDALDESLGAETASAGTSGSTTLTTSQIPSHAHKVAGSQDSGGNDYGANFEVNNFGTVAGGRDDEADTSPVGGGSGHTHTTPAVSTLQSSKTLYIWKRTA